MKNLLSIWILILCSAQITAKDITVSLKGQMLPYAREHYYVEDIILSQQEDSCLGYIHGAGNSLFIPVFFEHSILSELRSLMNSALPESREKQPVILRVNRIFLFENRFEGDVGIHLQLSVSFLFREGESFREDYTALYSSRIRFRNLKEAPQQIARSFDVCFKQYDEKLKEGLISRKLISAGQLRVNPLETTSSFSYPVMKNPSRGLFFSYLHFRDGFPDTNTRYSIHIKYNKKESRLNEYYLKGDEKTDFTKIWGFCDGTTMFVNTGKYFTPISTEGEKLTLWLPSYEFGKNMVFGSVLGGILFGIPGALVFGGLAGINSDPNSVMKCEMDPYDGKSLPYGFNNYTFLSSALIFTVSKTSPEDSRVRICIEEKELCELTPGSYFQLDLSCRFKNVRIKLISSFGTEIEEDILVQFLGTHLALIRIKKNHTIGLESPFGEIKKELLDKRTLKNTICSVDMFKTEDAEVVVK